MKKFKYIIVLFVMGLISFSCTDLDEEIFSEITTDNYYQNSNNIYAALVNNYAKAFSTGWSDARYFLQEVTADQLMIPTRGKHGYNGGSMFVCMSINGLWRRISYIMVGLLLFKV
ncbi:hypothetical protein [Parabacteroides distasonis]|uniref:hypothetical protein n=1 Tax=Parabacteroides distasonis TaxID=823 RepID=UPI0021C988C1|nr:hypothetical protein [Parabacteroides distasonis]